MDFTHVNPNPAYETVNLFVPSGDTVNEVLIYTVSTVPEPGSLVLSLIGAGSVLGYRGWRRATASAT